LIFIISITRCIQRGLQSWSAELRKNACFYTDNVCLPECSTDSGADDRQGAPTFVMSVTDTGHVGNRHSICLHPPADIGTSVGLQK